MQSAFQRIENYFLEFQHGILRLQSDNVSISADLKDAYNRLARLRDRYCHEKDNLTAQQNTVLSKVFENDPFIQGLCTLRQVGEHVARPEGVKILTTKNVPIYISASCSALSVFPDTMVTLPTVSGVVHRLDHISNLKEAEQRIARAINKAKTIDS